MVILMIPVSVSVSVSVSVCVFIWSIVFDEISPWFRSVFCVHSFHSLKVPSESTVVSGRFHIFQLPLCCTMTHKTAAAVFAQVSTVCVS